MTSGPTTRRLGGILLWNFQKPNFNVEKLKSDVDGLNSVLILKKISGIFS